MPQDCLIMKKRKPPPLNIMLCFTMLNTFVISIVHANTSDPFLIKKPIVSSTAHVHMVVDAPGWYANCKSPRPRLIPKSSNIIQSISFSTRLLKAIDL